MPENTTESTPQVGQSKASPLIHGRATGHVKENAVTTFNGKTATWRSPAYRAAEVLHGWGAHELHTADPFEITFEDFNAALATASEADEHGQYAPYVPALAPHLKGAI